MPTVLEEQELSSSPGPAGSGGAPGAAAPPPVASPPGPLVLPELNIRVPAKPQKPRVPVKPTHSWRAPSGHPCHLATSEEKTSLVVQVDAPADDSGKLDRFDVEISAINPKAGPIKSSERTTLAVDRERFLFRDLVTGWYQVTLLSKEGGGSTPVATQEVEVVAGPATRSPEEEPLRFVAHDPPSLGQLHLQLFNRDGSQPLASRAYTISGDKSFSGTTDGRGVLRHRRVPPGSYSLKIDGATETAVALVLSSFDPIPQVRFLE